MCLCWLDMKSDRRGEEEGQWRLIWHHLLLQNSWRALVQMFLVVDMDASLGTGSRIELHWGPPIMVDTILFLIYGVTWCIGVTMPVVIFCIYRIFLRWGWDFIILEAVQCTMQWIKKILSFQRNEKFAKFKLDDVDIGKVLINVERVIKILKLIF